MTPPCGSHPALLPFLAAAGDWLEALLPFLFVGFWILSQVIAAVRRVGGRTGPRPDDAAPVPSRSRRPAVRPDQPSRGDNAVPTMPPEPSRRVEPQRPAEIDEQIAEFLRTVRGERPEPRPPAGPPHRRPTAAPGPAPARQPAAADHRVGTLDAGQTGVARHVQDVFSHELRHLQAGLPAARTREAAQPVAARPPASPADELVAMLRNPATVRQLILLREVLDRPVGRW